jgi:hypothetical protein
MIFRCYYLDNDTFHVEGKELTTKATRVPAALCRQRDTKERKNSVSFV